MSPVSGFILLSLVAAALYLLGLVSFLKDYESGKCDMTYMFEYPQYVQIPHEADVHYPKYGLYVYSEGRLTERARSRNFKGIPVLFIPGSAGSHKQVRSLASIALRKAINSRSKFHFDYFAVDLNNELNALNGALLEAQYNYVNSTIETILNLYNWKGQIRRSIILIGHSMGGVIAKAIVSNLPSRSDLVPLVITLSAPLKRPVINVDHYMNSFYRERVVESPTIPTKERSTSFVSIAGGFNDFLVPPQLTEGPHLNVIATNVPKCWVSSDHLSILWCKQLILAVNRALFDCVDPFAKRLIDDRDERLRIFAHHLVRNSGIKIKNNALVQSGGGGGGYEERTPMSTDGIWRESSLERYSVDLPRGTKDVQWYMVPIKLMPAWEHLSVVAINLEVTDWVFYCSARVDTKLNKYCDIGKHLTHLSEIAPSAAYKRRMLNVNMHQIKLNDSSASHVIVRVLPTTEQVRLQFDISNPKERRIVVDDPPAWYSVTPQVVLHETDEGAILYDIILPHLTQTIQVYTLYVEPKCTGPRYHTTISLDVPWSNHQDHKYLTDVLKTPLTFRLYKSKPRDGDEERHARIRLTLDPTCRYKVALRSSFDPAALVRFYSVQLIANVAAVVLITLSYQLRHIGSTERCSVVFAALKEAAKPYFVLTAVKVLARLLDNDVVTRFLPHPDQRILSAEDMDVLWMPLLLYLTSVAVVWIASLVLSLQLVFFESTLHRVGMKVFAKAFGGGKMLWTDHILKAFEKVPALVATVLIVMSASTCGGLALCLATIFYFIKLTQTAQDFVEDLVKNVVKVLTRKLAGKLWAKFETTGKPSTTTTTTTDHLPGVEVMEADQPSAAESGGDNNKESAEDIERPMVFELVSDVSDGEQVRKMNGDKLVELFRGSQSDINHGDNGHQEGEKMMVEPFTWIGEHLENNGIFFHFTIFLLYLIVALLNVPSVLTWARNYRYSKSLSPDPAYVPALILCCCALPLWQLSCPKVGSRYIAEMSYIAYGAAIVSLLYGLVSIYRLSFIIAAVVTMITLHQVFAPSPAIRAKLE